MKRTTVFAVTLIILFSGGCESFSGAPQAAIDAAFNNVMNVDHSFGGHCVDRNRGRSKFECTDFTVGNATEKDITPADKKNGISEKFAILVDFSWRSSTSTDPNKWRQGERCITVANTNGSWTATDWTTRDDLVIERCGSS